MWGRKEEAEPLPVRAPRGWMNERRRAKEMQWYRQVVLGCDMPALCQARRIELPPLDTGKCRSSWPSSQAAMAFEKMPLSRLGLTKKNHGNGLVIAAAFSW
jgi:hypothetical protein